MATSPLAAALKPVTSVDADAESRYQSALKQMTEALDQRKNRIFDPTLLAMVQGFAAPTQSGSFFESLGNVAKFTGAAEEKEMKEAQEIAALRLQMAQAEREMSQRAKAASAFQNIVSKGRTETGVTPEERKIFDGETSTLTTAPVSQTAPAASAGASAAPARAEDQSTAQSVTIDDALSYAARYPEQKEMSRLLMDAAKAGSDRFKVAMNGTVFDTWSGKYVTQIPPGQTASSYFIAEAKGNLLMTPGQHSDYQAARARGQGKKWVQDFMSEEGPTPAGADTTGAPKPILTQADIEAEAARKKTTAEKTATAETERTQAAIEAGRSAGSRITHFKTMEGYARDPSVTPYLGYFERPDFISAAGKFVEEGRFGMPAIREILTNLNAPQDAINKLTVLGSMAAQTSIDFSRTYGKGQGAVSDFERRLYASLGPTIKDPAQAFIMKSRLLTAKAEYERDVAAALRKSKMQLDDFMDTPEYQRLTNGYQLKSYEVAGIKPSQTAAPAATNAPETADSLKARLRPKGQQ